MQHIQHIITRQTWLVCLSVLSIALACDQFTGGALTLGVVLVCVLRVIGFALDIYEDGEGQQ